MTNFSIIDIDTWSSGQRLILASGWIVFALFDIALTAYIYKKHLPGMIDTFDNSPGIKLLVLNLRNQGPIARSLLISFIAGAITYAPLLTKQGYVSADDVDKIHPRTKRLLSIDSVLSSITLLWAAAICVFISTRGNSQW